MDIVGYITKLQTNVLHIRNDDDLADRLNYRYTVAILVAFAVIVTNRQFSESVIKCWVPAYFTANFEAYANQVCWVSNTYYANHTQQLPKDDEIKKDSEIKYYQWIPFILLIQALFLYIPRIFWRMLSTRAGIELRDIIEAANSYKSVKKFNERDDIMKYIVDNIDQYLSNKRRLKNRDKIMQKIKYYIDSFCFGAGVYLGNYLLTTYVVTKILYIINSLLQFFLMNEFLGKQFHVLGFALLQYYFSNSKNLHGMLESVYFPKVVMCDFRIREFGHPNFSHRYSIQCVLPINLYNQQIFTFLWFWFLILIFANTYAVVSWIYQFLPTQRRMYVKNRLKLMNRYQKLLSNKEDPCLRQHIKATLEDFNGIYLKCDGVLIIKMISMLASEVVGTRILHELWRRRKHFNRACNEMQQTKPKDPSPPNDTDWNNSKPPPNDPAWSTNKPSPPDEDFFNEDIVRQNEEGTTGESDDEEENEVDETEHRRDSPPLSDQETQVQPRTLKHNVPQFQQTNENLQPRNLRRHADNRPKKMVVFAPTPYAPFHQSFIREHDNQARNDQLNDAHAYNHKSTYPFIDQSLYKE